MPKSVLSNPHEIRVKRSQLRGNQRKILSKAKGQTILVISENGDGEEKLVLDKKYFDALLRHLRSAVETLEITTNKPLFAQIISAAETLEDDVRAGRLHSMDEVFGEK